MSMTINGIASIKGIGSAGATVTFTGVTATITPKTAAYSVNAPIEKLQNGEGATVAKGANDVEQRVALELLITGASIAVAKTLADPAPLAIVTLAAFNHATLNGTWNYEEGWNVQTGPDFAKVSMVLTRTNGAALAAAS